MKKILFLICCISVVGISNLLEAQEMMAKTKKGDPSAHHAANNTTRNYYNFTPEVYNFSAEALKENAGYEKHPEFGLLTEGAPDKEWYEVIGARTAINKTYKKEGTTSDGGKDIMVETSNEPIHYKDFDGNWKTIKTRLKPVDHQKGIYAASEQPIPITINTIDKFTTIGKDDKTFKFNNNLELLFQKEDGTIQSLGFADWSNHTAGDEGVYINNAWAGIDITLSLYRGAIKTNFIIQHAMHEYTNGTLLIRDHFEIKKDFHLDYKGEKIHKGLIEIRNKDNEMKYAVSVVSAYEQNDLKNTRTILEYRIDSTNMVEIALPGKFLNLNTTSYPYVIDPLVSTTTSTAITGDGSTYSFDWTVGCSYYNAATTPPNCTITDIQFASQYIADGFWGTELLNGAEDFYLGTCRSPTGATGLGGSYWYCNSILSGSCTATFGTTYSIYSDLSACIPAPSCASYNLGITMDLYQDYDFTGACDPTYVYAGQPYKIRVIGHTVEIVGGATGVTASPSTICSGSSSTLTVAGTYGVPPYSWSWTPGGMTGTTVTVSPSTTTTYGVTVTDACGITATASATVTVIAVTPITGTTTVCAGNTTLLSNSTAGGTWSSSNTAIATVSAGGVVTGVAAGTTTINYAVGGCTASIVVTVTPIPTAITGAATVCAGSTTLFTDATAGGTWSSSSTTIATVSATGTVSGVTAGTATITYSLGGGCYVTKTISVIAPSPITGTLTCCVGGTTLLSDATVGGAWTSSSTAVATVGATGLVTGVSAGTTTIIYTVGGCPVSVLVTVTAISPIVGTLSVCTGGTTVLSDATAGGTWTSSATGVATVGAATGIVNGVSAGTTTISYTTPAGCSVSVIVTVSASPIIGGALTVCAGSTTALTTTVGGGTWTSTSTTIATVGSSSGIVSGVSSGTCTISYTAGVGCSASTIVTVNPTPTAITGVTNTCVGTTSVLTDALGGGTWSSSNTAIATVGTGTGIVTGVASGTATITYTLPGGCYVTVSFVVNPVTPITGASSVCSNSTLTLTAGVAGTWSSSALTVATVGVTGVVYPVGAGTTTISYTSASGCSSALIVTVNPISPITGSLTICAGSTSALADATVGGTWTSSSTAIATVDATTGLVSGVSAGSSTIVYTTPAGCTASVIVNVNTLPTITGTLTVCAGSTTILTSTGVGGTWTSSLLGVATISATGIVSGVSAGTTTINYSAGTGCSASVIVTVNPISPITGILSTCLGGTTVLSDATVGTWSSSAPGIATVGATTGIVTSVAAGTTTIIFTTPTGCTTSALVTINTSTSITGTLTVCAGGSTTLAASVGGGTWSPTTGAIATIDASLGIVSGITGGTVVISYTTPTGCSSSATVTVNPLPTAITGTSSVCQSLSTTLADATIGGTWSSSNTGIATINATTGVVSGISPGSVTITYTSIQGCSITIVYNVNQIPPAISGTTEICIGANSLLNNSLSGGNWTSSDPAIATINTSGLVTGIATGNSTISYLSSAGCLTTATITVEPNPAAILGVNAICVGNATPLSDGTTGGTWSCSNNTDATINSVTGVISGLSAGAITVSYTSIQGCTTTLPFTVIALPLPITGTTDVCIGGTVTLSEAVTGGLWSSGTPAIATINQFSGVLTAVANGTTVVTYTSAAGCMDTIVVNVSTASQVQFYIKPDACIGEPIKVALTNPGNGISVYNWNFDGATILSANSNSGGPYTIEWTNPGTYVVQVTAVGTALCPTLEAYDTITIHKYPNANIQTPIWKNGNLCDGDSVLLQAQGNEQLKHYFWQPIQYFEQNDRSFVYGVIQFASYVSLTVTDPYGCTAKDSIYLNVQPCCIVAIPNAFSPNGDGLNDIFRPISLGKHQINEFRVVNRWGQVVYESTGQNVGWDGTFNGVLQEIGTYFFYLSYDCNGNMVMEKGDVTLVR